MSGRNGVCSYRRFLQGDVTALEELVREYGDALVRFAYCYVKDSAAAEDIMEDAFATLLVRRRHFSECDNLRAYLYKTVRNRCLDYLRKRKKANADCRFGKRAFYGKRGGGSACARTERNALPLYAETAAAIRRSVVSGVLRGL